MSIAACTLIITALSACDAQPGDKTSGQSSPSTESAPMTKIEILQHSEKKETLDGSTYRTIHVQVQNSGTILQDYVEIKATWFDKDGKVVGTGMGNTTNLAANAKRVIDVQGMEVDNAAKYELEIATTPFQ
jgi:hypothetical protein